MKKHIAKTLMLVLIVVLAFFGLAACAGNSAIVTFDLGDGAVLGQQGYDPITVVKGSEIDFSTLAKPNAKEGYLFVGWDANGQLYKASDKLTVEEDITLKAVFKRTEITVTFALGDKAALGQTGYEAQAFTYGDEFNFASIATPAGIVGYEFANWKIGDTDYAATDTLTLTQDVTIEAVFERIEITVTFALGDKAAAGQTGYEAQTLAYGDEFSFASVATPTGIVGYEFANWKIGDTNYSATDTVALTQDTVIEAVFKLKEYTIIFNNAANEEIAQFKIAHGTTPTEPIFNDTTFKQYINVTAATRDKFVGWTAGGTAVEVGAATADVTYTASYQTEDILYTLTFTHGAQASVYMDSKVVTNYVGKYQDQVAFRIELKEGAVVTDGVSFKVKLGEEEISAVNGIYTVTLTATQTVTVSGIEWAKYDTVIKSTNAEVDTTDAETGNPNANFGVSRGDSFRFKTKGAKGYTDNMPTVTYRGMELDAETKDADGWYVFLIQNVTSTEVLTIKGSIDYFEIQYVQLDGSIIKHNWNVENGVAGKRNSPDTVTGEKFDPEDLIMDGKDYALVVKEIEWIKYFSVTKSADLANRVITKEQADAWIGAVDTQFLTPVKGEENVYYLVYIVDTNVPLVEYTFVLPDGYTNLAVTIGGVAWEAKNIMFGWNDGAQGYLPTVRLKNIPVGAEIALTYDLPSDVPYQTYQNGEIRIDAVDKIYRFTAIREDLLWILDTEYVTVILPELNTASYDLYNQAGNRFNGREQKIPKGSDLGFRITFNIKLTDIERQYEAFCNAFRAGGYTIEFVEDPLDYYIRVIGVVKNIDADVELSFAMPEEKPYQLLFKVYNDFTYQVDGKDVVPEAGATTVVISMTQSSSVLTLVPKAGYMFKAGYSFKPKWSYSRVYKGGVIKQPSSWDTIGATAVPNSFNWVLDPKDNNDAPMVEADNTTATDAQKLHTISYTLIPLQWNVTQFKDRFDVVANGGVFKTTPPDFVLNGGDYTLTLTAPTGETATMYVEYGDRKAEGFKQVKGVKVENNQYTFTVSDVSCDIRWYILLEVSMYEVSFVYNEEILLQLTVPHGTSLEDIKLPTEIVATKDGVEGYYKIAGWQWLGGSEALLIDKAGTLAPILGEFIPYAAKVQQTYYKTVGEAIASLSSYLGTEIVNIDVLCVAADTLAAGTYTIPKNVVLRLPYAVEGYGERFGLDAHTPSVMYVDEGRGTVRLIVAAGVTLNVYGTVSVGAIVGYPASGMPYQGHTSSYHAILQLDGKINIYGGGRVEAHGLITGTGEVEAHAGGTVAGRFVVKDYRGGTNSSNVFGENIAPFNVYEMPNILVKTTVHYGASEIAYAMLFAMNVYNPVEIEVLGAKGLIQPAVGGKIVKTAKRIANSRYTDALKAIEPRYEHRIQLDVYGGGTDGVMELLGLVDTKQIPMAISYIYDIHLHDGSYVLKNGYKIMPGGALTVEHDASLEILFTEGLLGSLTAYGADFRDNFGTYAFNQKRLLYPPIDVAGKFTVDGTLVVRGRLGAPIHTANAGAKIKVYSKDTFLSVEQREGIHLSVTAEPNKPLDLTYNKRVEATVDGVKVQQGGIYESRVMESGQVEWVKTN